jgi:hypothetical protein
MTRLEIGCNGLGGNGGKYQYREEKGKHDKQTIRHTTYTSKVVGFLSSSLSWLL